MIYESLLKKSLALLLYLGSNFVNLNKFFFLILLLYPFSRKTSNFLSHVQPLNFFFRFLSSVYIYFISYKCFHFYFFHFIFRCHQHISIIKLKICCLILPTWISFQYTTFYYFLFTFSFFNFLLSLSFIFCRISFENL